MSRDGPPWGCPPGGDTLLLATRGALLAGRGAGGRRVPGEPLGRPSRLGRDGRVFVVLALGEKPSVAWSRPLCAPRAALPGHP